MDLHLAGGRGVEKNDGRITGIIRTLRRSSTPDVLRTTANAYRAILMTSASSLSFHVYTHVNYCDLPHASAENREPYHKTRTQLRVSSCTSWVVSRTADAKFETVRGAEVVDVRGVEAPTDRPYLRWRRDARRPTDVV